MILRPKGSPLTPRQLDTIASVTAQDEQQAIVLSFPVIRLYLNAIRITATLR